MLVVVGGSAQVPLAPVPGTSALLLAWHEEVFLHLFEMFEELVQLLSPFELRLGQVGEASTSTRLCPLIHPQPLHLAVVNVSEHDEALLADALDVAVQLLKARVAAFAILIHNVLAEAIVPSLQLVVSDQIHEEASLDVPIAVESTALVANDNVVARMYVAIAEVNAIVETVPDDVMLKLAR